MKRLLGILLSFCLLCPISASAIETNATEEPIMKIGIISDLQATSSTSEGMKAAFSAFEFFKEKGVDAVINAGDIADSNSNAVYSAYTKKYAEILGDTPHVSVSGNHDIWSEAELSEYNDFFGSPNSHKIINGFHFITIGSEGSDTNGNYSQASKDYAAAELAAAAADANGAPIFLITHQHISNTVYGSADWGNDFLWGIVDKYPNVIHFSGHSHFVLDDERSIWQGDFTAIGTSSLSYTELEYGKANGSVPPDANEAKQYLYLEIFEDRIEIDRIKAATGKKIKDTWVLSLPLSKETFTYTDARAESRTEPYFEQDAKLSAEISNKDLVVTFDAGKHDDFVHSYRLRLTDGNDKQITNILIFSDFYKGLENMSDTVSYTLKGCVNPLEEYILYVYPIESWGKEGEPLVKRFFTVDPVNVPDTIRGPLFSCQFSADGVENTSSTSAASILTKDPTVGIANAAYALLCDGDDGLRIKIPTSYYTLTPRKFTLEAAFSVNSFDEKQTVISCFDEKGMEIYTDTEGNVCFNALLDGGDTVSFSAPIKTQTITHVAVTASSSELAFYVDGKKLNSIDFSGKKVAYNRNANYTLGMDADGGARLYGEIYAASLAGTTATADDIAELYTNGTTLYNYEAVAPLYSELRRMMLISEASELSIVKAICDTFIEELTTMLTTFTMPQSTIDSVLAERDIDDVLTKLGVDTSFSPSEAPSVSGVEGGEAYDLFAEAPAAEHNGDYAILNLLEYTSGTALTSVGYNRLVAFNGITPTIVDFRTFSSYLPPVISGVEDGKTYDLYRDEAPAITWEPADLAATLDNQPYTAGTPVTALGWHTLIINDGVANYVFAFKIEDNTPVISGVEQGRVYDLRKENAPAASWNFEGTATLDGEAYEMGTPIEAVGEHTLTVTDGADITLSVTFTVVSRMKGDLDGDDDISVSDALSALRIAAKLVEPTEENIAVGDVDGDGSITVTDALSILRVAAGLIDSL